MPRRIELPDPDGRMLSPHAPRTHCSFGDLQARGRLVLAVHRGRQRTFQHPRASECAGIAGRGRAWLHVRWRHAGTLTFQQQARRARSGGPVDHHGVDGLIFSACPDCLMMPSPCGFIPCSANCTTCQEQIGGAHLFRVCDVIVDAYACRPANMSPSGPSRYNAAPIRLHLHLVDDTTRLTLSAFTDCGRPMR